LKNCRTRIQKFWTGGESESEKVIPATSDVDSYFLDVESHSLMLVNWQTHFARSPSTQSNFGHDLHNRM